MSSVSAHKPAEPAVEGPRLHTALLKVVSSRLADHSRRYRGQVGVATMTRGTAPASRDERLPAGNRMLAFDRSTSATVARHTGGGVLPPTKRAGCAGW